MDEQDGRSEKLYNLRSGSMKAKIILMIVCSLAAFYLGMCSGKFVVLSTLPLCQDHNFRSNEKIACYMVGD